MIQKKITDPRSSDHGTNESLPRLDPLAPLMHHDLSDLGSMILILDHLRGTHPNRVLVQTYNNVLGTQCQPPRLAIKKGSAVCIRAKWPIRPELILVSVV